MSLPKVHRLFLDTYACFNPEIPTDGPKTSKEKTLLWSRTADASRALSLLPSAADREKALRFFQPSDAALSVASSLLKLVAVCRATGTPWSDRLVITQERHIANGKPFFGPGGVRFNASHHGQLAVLAYAADEDPSGKGSPSQPAPAPEVGIDVVHVDVLKGLIDMQRSGGWRSWSGIFAEAFSPAEMESIQGAMQQPGSSGGRPANRTDLEAALRLFYTYWALKEAYIKMTSEAFMADWLRVLEFRNVRAPRPAAKATAEATAEAATAEATVAAGSRPIPGTNSNRDAEDGSWTEGETIRDIEIWLRNERVENVCIEIQAVGKSYMVATAVQRSAEVGRLERVGVVEDVVPLTL